MANFNYNEPNMIRRLYLFVKALDIMGKSNINCYYNSLQLDKHYKRKAFLL